MNLYIVVVKNKNLLYDPYVAFLDRKRAMAWIKNQKRFKRDWEILLFSIPDDWGLSPFEAIFVALWYDRDMPSFFPDSISLSRNDAKTYIKLLPKEIQKNCTDFGIVIQK